MNYHMLLTWCLVMTHSAAQYTCEYLNNIIYFKESRQDKAMNERHRKQNVQKCKAK